MTRIPIEAITTAIVDRFDAAYRIGSAGIPLPLVGDSKPRYESLIRFWAEKFRETTTVDAESRVLYGLTNDGFCYGRFDAFRRHYGDNVLFYKSLCQKDCPICRSVYTQQDGLPRTMNVEQALSCPMNLVDHNWYNVIQGGELSPSLWTIGSTHWRCEAVIYPYTPAN